MSKSKLFVLIINIFPVFQNLFFFWFVGADAAYTFYLVEPKIYNDLINDINKEANTSKNQAATRSEYLTEENESLGFNTEKYICRETDLVFVSKQYGKEIDTTLSLNIKEHDPNRLSFLLLLGADKCILESSEDSPVKLIVRIINKLSTSKLFYNEFECECKFVRNGKSKNTNDFNLYCGYDTDVVDITGPRSNKEKGGSIINFNSLASTTNKTEEIEPKPSKNPPSGLLKGKYSDFFWKNAEAPFGEKFSPNSMLTCRANGYSLSNKERAQSECSADEQQLIINIFHGILKKIIEYINKS
ncbi:hypothetical protein FG379_003154 [Cryptosporidium bovis]|uniref:uncharacterized protein n=1 Tax=Cryptosporidium bovis TaxID=310047 RepID=UPI00351A47C6|nr:hypothetical protein FG379_003154 [Cryptosporidium bovis]